MRNDAKGAASGSRPSGKRDTRNAVRRVGRSGDESVGLKSCYGFQGEHQKECENNCAAKHSLLCEWYTNTDIIHVRSRLLHRTYSGLSRIEAVIREIVVLATKKEVPFLAASIAYYAFAALIPLLLFAFIVISTIGGTDLAVRIVVVTQGFLTPTSQELIRNAVTQTEGRTGVIVGAGLVFVWSVFRLLRGLEIAISMVYETELSPPVLTQLTTAAMLFLALLIAGTGLVSISVLFAVLPDLPLIGFVSAGAVLVALILVFWPIYYLLPAIDHSLVDALPGAIVAAVSWAILNTLFGIYAAYASQYEVYGVLGGVLLLLTWFYISGVIIVFGAVINAVLY